MQIIYQIYWKWKPKSTMNWIAWNQSSNRKFELYRIFYTKDKMFNISTVKSSWINSRITKEKSCMYCVTEKMKKKHLCNLFLGNWTFSIRLKIQYFFCVFVFQEYETVNSIYFTRKNHFILFKHSNIWIQL